MTKICSKCVTEKSIEAFSKNPHVKNKLLSYCKECAEIKKVEAKEEAFREKLRIKRAEAEKRNKYLKKRVERREREDSYNKNKNLKTNYGLTDKQYKLLLISQNFSCAICGTHQSKLSRALDVDHCHTTGKIRGLLCTHCNVGLGHFKDSVDLLAKASEYLTKNY